MIRYLPSKYMSVGEFCVACSKIPKDHNLILCSLAEFGEQNLAGIRNMYIHTHKDDKQLLIDELIKGVELLKCGKFEELSNLGEV